MSQTEVEAKVIAAKYYTFEAFLANLRKIKLRNNIGYLRQRLKLLLNISSNVMRSKYFKWTMHRLSITFGLVTF